LWVILCYKGSHLLGKLMHLAAIKICGMVVKGLRGFENEIWSESFENLIRAKVSVNGVFNRLLITFLNFLGVFVI